VGAPQIENKGEIHFVDLPQQFPLPGRVQSVEMLKDMILIEFLEERKGFNSIHEVIIGEKSRSRKTCEQGK